MATVVNKGWTVFGSNPAITITSAADLTNGNTLLSAAYNNAPAGGTTTPQCYTTGDVELFLPNGLSATISVEQPVAVYFIPSYDGTNYLDFVTNFGTGTGLDPQDMYVSSLMVEAQATASTPQRVGLRDLPLPPYSFKMGICNLTGVSLKDGATHFTVKLFIRTEAFS